jgi:hypothetical protein
MGRAGLDARPAQASPQQAPLALLRAVVVLGLEAEDLGEMWPEMALAHEGHDLAAYRRLDGRREPHNARRPNPLPPTPNGGLSSDYRMCSLIAVLLSCAFNGV